MKSRNRILIMLLGSALLGAAQQGCNTKEVHQHKEIHQAVYSCPMHPQIRRNAPGKCSICGMQLVKVEKQASSVSDLQLKDLVKPTNEFVLSKVPVTVIQTGTLSLKQEVLGRVAYDTRAIGTISSRVSGRIERLYVRYRFQKISAGQKIMDIYSPELLTYQQNLLFLLRNDPTNTALLQATRERLLANGMSNQQLSDVVRLRKASNTITIYSNYGGHIHEAGSNGTGMPPVGTMKVASFTTEALTIKEGSYVEKGKPIFSVNNPEKAWALLQLYGDQQGMVKVGDEVVFTPETAPDRQVSGRLNVIEPFYREGQKSIAARVYFNNAKLQLPIGSQVRATIYSGSKVMNWLPEEAIISLGREKVVFKKQDGGFIAKHIVTGAESGGRIQILSGLLPTDSVAANGQFLMDSESFIKANE